MLNKEGIRELAYIAEITDVRPIEGYDRVELVVVNGGWTCVVGKGQFSKGDLAVYFEIDSKLPEKEPFSNNEFLVKKKYKVQTQKMCKSISQGLIMGLSEFGFDPTQYKKGDFLTEQLGVTYAIKEDNIRKSNRKIDKYSKMARRHPNVAKTWIWKFLWKYNWGKKLLFIFFGKQKDRTGWPEWVVKTDEERIQNMPWILADKEPWIVTEKIDGTSTTFTVHRHKRSKTNYDFYVCSRNVVFDTDGKQCFYDENYYTKMAEKYDVRKILTEIAVEGNYEWVTLQGETFGPGVQKRDYSLKTQEFLAFNFITDREGRWNSKKAEEFLAPYHIYWVPILDEHFILPDTVEEMLKYADGESVCDHGMREGVVLRSLDATKSFKAVSNEYLLHFK